MLASAAFHQARVSVRFWILFGRRVFVVCFEGYTAVENPSLVAHPDYFLRMAEMGVIWFRGSPNGLVQAGTLRYIPNIAGVSPKSLVTALLC